MQSDLLTTAFAEVENTAQDTMRVPVATNSTSSNFKLWCLKDFDDDCYDMSNNLSTYLGIIAGAAIAGVISWWVYNPQNKTASKQDHILDRVKEIERKIAKY